MALGIIVELCECGVLQNSMAANFRVVACQDTEFEISDSRKKHAVSNSSDQTKGLIYESDFKFWKRDLR